MPAVGDSLPQSPALSQGSELLLPCLSGGLWWNYQVTSRKGLLYNVHEKISNEISPPNSYNFSAVSQPAPKVFSYLGLWQLKSLLHLFFSSSGISADFDEVTWTPAPVSEMRTKVWGCRAEVRGTFLCSTQLSEAASPLLSPALNFTYSSSESCWLKYFILSLYGTLSKCTGQLLKGQVCINLWCMCIK